MISPPSLMIQKDKAGDNSRPCWPPQSKARVHCGVQFPVSYGMKKVRIK